LDDSWQYSQGGASVYKVAPGAVEGWSWGPGAVNQAVPPPDINFDEVCQTEATNTPTPETTIPGPVAVVQRAEPGAAETNSGQDAQMMGEPKAEPTALLTLIGESVVDTIGAGLGEPDIADQDSSSIAGSDSLPYLVFLVIVVGLGGLLWFVSFRRKQH